MKDELKIVRFTLPLGIRMGRNARGSRLVGGTADTEGAKFWLVVLTELRNRGVAGCTNRMRGRSERLSQKPLRRFIPRHWYSFVSSTWGAQQHEVCVGQGKESRGPPLKRSVCSSQ